MREYLLVGNEHPSKLFPDCFSEDPPVAAITYEWRLSFADILSYLNPAQATPSPRARRLSPAESATVGVVAERPQPEGVLSSLGMVLKRVVLRRVRVTWEETSALMIRQRQKAPL